MLKTRIIVMRYVNRYGFCLYVPHGKLGNPTTAGLENRPDQSMGTGLIKSGMKGLKK